MKRIDERDRVLRTRIVFMASGHPPGERTIYPCGFGPQLIQAGLALLRKTLFSPSSSQVGTHAELDSAIFATPPRQEEWCAHRKTVHTDSVTAK